MLSLQSVAAPEQASATSSAPQPDYVPAVGDVVTFNVRYGSNVGIVFWPAGYNYLGVVDANNSWNRLKSLTDVKKVSKCKRMPKCAFNITSAYGVAEAYFSKPTGTYAVPDNIQALIDAGGKMDLPGVFTYGNHSAWCKRSSDFIRTGHGDVRWKNLGEHLDSVTSAEREAMSWTD